MTAVYDVFVTSGALLPLGLGNKVTACAGYITVVGCQMAVVNSAVRLTGLAYRSKYSQKLANLNGAHAYTGGWIGDVATEEPVMPEQ